MTKPSIIPPAGRALAPDEYAELLDDMEALVHRSHLFKSLDDVGRERVLDSAHVETFAEGDVIFHQYEPGDTMLLVLHGKVSVTTESEAGEVKLAELGSGAVIGEVSVVTSAPRTATVTALTDVDAIAFARHRIERVLEDYPKVKELLVALVERRATDAVEKILG